MAGLISRIGTVLCAFGVFASGAIAQIDEPAITNVREKISGEFLSADGEPAPEAGDQVGAFFGDQAIGKYTFISTQADIRTFEMTVYGDDDETEVVEGPTPGQGITFRFFDSSTNMLRTDVAGLNTQGEVSNFNFEGAEVIPFPFGDFPGLPPFSTDPSREINLLLGESPPNGGGGGDSEQPRTMDVDGNGHVDKSDAALVIRLIVGSNLGTPEGAVERADVNGDGVINTSDAIEILRNR